MIYEEKRPCWWCGGRGGRCATINNRKLLRRCFICQGTGSIIIEALPIDIVTWASWKANRVRIWAESRTVSYDNSR